MLLKTQRCETQRRLDIEILQGGFWQLRISFLPVVSSRPHPLTQSSTLLLAIGTSTSARLALEEMLKRLKSAESAVGNIGTLLSATQLYSSCIAAVKAWWWCVRGVHTHCMDFFPSKYTFLYISRLDDLFPSNVFELSLCRDKQLTSRTPPPPPSPEICVKQMNCVDYTVVKCMGFGSICIMSLLVTARMFSSLS